MSDQQLAAQIVQEAVRQGVDPAVALAFAIAESNVRNVVGDTKLYARGGYMDAVRREHPGHPDLAAPEGWVSYGPFQLQARWFLRDGERLADLKQSALTIPRAIAHIRKKLTQYDEDPVMARLAYVCGTPGNCSNEKHRRVVRRFDEAMRAAEMHLGETQLETSDVGGGVPAHLLLAGALIAMGLHEVLKGGRQ